MPNLDHSLLYEARKFITAANVHRVKTWIFCYETSKPNSSRRKRYEQLLREFVNTKRLTVATRIFAKFAVARGQQVRLKSLDLEEEIKRGDVA
jgi:hypothetical protein